MLCLLLILLISRKTFIDLICGNRKYQQSFWPALYRNTEGANITKQRTQRNPQNMGNTTKQESPREEIATIEVASPRRIVRSAIFLSSLEMIRQTTVNLKDERLTAL